MANRFWKSQPVSGAIVSVASPPQVRLTVSSTTGITTGDVCQVFGIVGTTEANGTWTVTVIDGTHLDLQSTTFANLYTSGGNVNGKWNSSNTNNWVTTSGGTNYGQTVPTTTDDVTLDGSSGGGTVTVNNTITVQSITFGAFTGTLDFSANNNNVTLVNFSGTGSGTRTLNLGNGTWTLTGTGNAWNFTTTTNLTFNKNSSVLVFTVTSASNRNFLGGGLSYNTVTVSANTSGGGFNITGANTFTDFNITAPNFVAFPISTTTTITNAFTWAGTSSANIGIAPGTVGTVATISVASGSPTMSWTGVRELTFTGGATFTATNSLNLGRNTGITITVPILSVSRSRAFSGMS